MENICPVCNNKFITQIKKKKFCSISCRNKYNESMRLPRMKRTRNRFYTPRPKIKQQCRFCKKTFLGWNNKLYCSKICRERKRDRSNYIRIRDNEFNVIYRKQIKKMARDGPMKHSMKLKKIV